ncbi:MAG: hypothetical protein COB66_07955 [Coxiella sp. (in: Bacteria)]|nr:MAG: hypothetical protein COB66_07955 [Coxiella sp. (in: g-proteobacteria)]
MEYEQKRANKDETPQDRQFISELFSRLNTICTAGFHNLKMLSAQEAQSQIKLNMREWMNEFQIRGINKPELVDYALGRIRASGSPFIPTVGEFLDYCDEGRLPTGTLSARDAYEEWLQYDMGKLDISKLSQPAYHTMSVIYGSGRKGHLTGSKPAESEKYWTTRYTATLDRMKEGKPLKCVPGETEKLEYIRQPGKRSTMMDAMAEMRKNL